MIYTPRHSLERSNQRKLDGCVMWYVCETREMCAGFWFVSIKGRHHFKNLSMRILENNIKMDLKGFELDLFGLGLIKVGGVSSMVMNFFFS